LPQVLINVKINDVFGKKSEIKKQTCLQWQVKCWSGLSIYFISGQIDLDFYFEDFQFSEKKKFLF